MFSSLIFSLCCALFIWGCGGDNTAIQTLAQEKPPVLPIGQSVTDAQIDIASNSNNDFAFDMTRYIKRDNKNHFLSSYTLYTMLNTLIPGARGETKEEILYAGHIAMDEKEWERYFQALHSKTIKFLDQNNTAFHFSFANSLWVEKGINVNPDYIQQAEAISGLRIHTIDFTDENNKALETINRWISEKTDNHIQNMLDSRTINRESKIVLVNAMYLKALWSHSFFPGDTKPMPFILEDGTEISVPMMHQINRFRYVEKEGAEILCMRYQESEFGLVTLMPPAGKFSEFEASLNNDLLDYFASDFTWQKIDLYYPKYEIKNDIVDLKPLLIQKGMKTAFSEDADFSGIDKDADLRLSSVVQQIYLKIDEEGTEAASSTAVAVGSTDAEPAKEVIFNRPFVVMICHIPTRTILFMGRVVNPLL